MTIVAQRNSLRDLQRQPRYRSIIWRRNAYLLSALAIDLFVIGLLATLVHDVFSSSAAPRGQLGLEPISWGTLAWAIGLLFVQLAGAQGNLMLALRGTEVIQLAPTNESGDRTFGGLTGPQIVDLVRDVAREFGIGHVDQVALTEHPDPNAYTAWLLGTGNVVVLHSNLFAILPRDGIRSVIAHELAHIGRKDSLLLHLVALPRSFVQLLIFLALVKLAAIEWVGHWEQAALLIVLTGCAVLLSRRMPALIHLASQQQEFIADAQAARICGWELTINSLLLMGERGEALMMLRSWLHELAGKIDDTLSERALLRIVNRFPPHELDEDEARFAAPRIYIEDQLEQLRNGLGLELKPKQIKELAARAARQFHAAARAQQEEQQAEHAVASTEQEEPENSPAEPEYELTDWREFDADRSGHLDLHETTRLVQQLREDPRRMLFRQFLCKDVDWQSHPTMRRRVLSLYDLFAPPQGRADA